MVINISWLCFKIIYNVQTPVHIGTGSQLGICNKTRYYIPGKTMWGAITATLTRCYMDENNHYNSKYYKEIGDFVKENLIFSYFYPYRKDNGEEVRVLHPYYSKNGFGFGIKEDNSYLVSQKEFESEYISSYVSTAISENTKTAVDESLHEIELLNPNRFIGYVIVKKDAQSPESNSTLKITSIIEEQDDSKRILIQISRNNHENKEIDFFDAIEKIQVGGERTYGFGQLKLGPSPKIVEGFDIGIDNTLDLNAEKPVVKMNVSLSHLKIKDDNMDNFEKLKSMQIYGEYEPLVWREWENSRGMGHTKKFNAITLIPGSSFKEQQQFSIGEYGLWNLKE